MIRRRVDRGTSRQTLRRRISTFLLLSVVIAVGSLDVASFFVEANYLNSASREKLIGSSYLVARSLLAAYEPGRLHGAPPLATSTTSLQGPFAPPPQGGRSPLFTTGDSRRGARIPNGTAAFLYSSSGRYLGKLTYGVTLLPSRLPPLQSISANGIAHYVQEGFFSIGSRDQSIPYLGLSRRLTQGRGYVLIVIPVTDARSTLTTLAITELAVTLLLIGLLLVASNVVIGREVLPLERLSAAAEEVARGNLGVRADISSRSSEIDSLVGSFNSMVVALEGQFKAREESAIALREFMASASHELGTPLTAILGFSEILLERGFKDEGEESIVKNIHEEAVRLNLLVGDLLNISKFDKPKPLEVEVFNLGEFIEDVISSYRVREPMVSFRADIQDQLFIRGDRLRLREVFDNLFVNSLLHSGRVDDLIIDVTLVRESGEVFVIFHDNGVGVSDSLAPQIFKPFIRGDRSRGGNRGGSGLGLSVAERIIVAHGGRITCEPDQGATFVLRLRTVEQG